MNADIWDIAPRIERLIVTEVGSELTVMRWHRVVAVPLR